MSRDGFNAQPESTMQSKLKEDSDRNDEIWNTLVNAENRFRLDVEKAFIQTQWGKFIQQFNAIAAGTSTIVYVVLTYEQISGNTILQMYTWYWDMEYIICMMMAILYLIKLYIQAHRMLYLFSSDSIMSLYTVIPVLVMEDKTMLAKFYVILATSRYMRLFFMTMELFKHFSPGNSDVEKQSNVIGCNFFLIVIVSAGFFAEIENSQFLDTIGPAPEYEQTFVGDYEPHNFHTALYFLVVTLITVGYGDINPQSSLGQIICLFFFINTIIYVPQQTGELLRLIGMLSIYRREEYKSTELKHLVVTGSIGYQEIQNFCDELFHPDHGFNSTNSVLIQNHDPSPEIDIYIHGKYERGLCYLAGNPLDEEVNKRAKTHKAEACILLTNKNSTNASDQDYRNILIGLAIKKFVYDMNKDQDDVKDSSNIKLCIQLIKPESKLLYYESLNLSPLQDQLIIVEEIKMNLLAKSCFAPGLISMISNLIASAGEIDSDGLPEWFKEYSEGMGHEIYRRQILEEDYQNDIVFKKLAEIAYQEEQAIVFALEIQSKANINESIIRLNPINFQFREWHRFNYFIYIICTDPEIADSIEKLDMSEEKYERLFGRPRKPIVSRAEMQRRKSQIGFNIPDIQNGDLKQKFGIDNESLFTNSKKFKGRIETDEISQKAQLNVQSEEEILSEMYTMLSKSQTQMEVSEEHLLSRLENHVVVCGIHSSIMHFILPLRAQYLKHAQQDIVIITPLQTIPTDIWDSISRFPRIFLINGSPLLLEVLRKAQVHRADKAVILGHDPTTGKSHMIQDEMLDAQSIFIYKAIKKCNPELQILTEMSFSSNIDFLQSRNVGELSEFCYSNLFAAGEVYISAIIDTLTAQAFYNPNIVTILQQLLVGRSGGFHQDFENTMIEHFGDKIAQANLWQINIPEEMVNKTFDKLHKFLLEKQLVTLGLYRLPGATDNSYAYVYTNPSPKTNITQRDRIFVLGVEVPRDLMINTNKDSEGSKLRSTEDNKPIEKKQKADADKKVLANSKDFYGLKTKTDKQLKRQNQRDSTMIKTCLEKTIHEKISAAMVEEGVQDDVQKEGGDNQIDSITQTESSQINIRGESQTKKVHFGKDISQDQKFNTNNNQIIINPSCNTVQPNTMEVLKSAAKNLDRRVRAIEEKITKIKQTIAGQNSEIKKQVQNEKEIWLQQFE